MKKLLSVSQMQELDRWAIEDIGIPAICLMENAGRQVADEVVRLLKRKSGSVCVVCGVGNNGGDGFVAARHLRNRGLSVSIILVGERSRFTNEALVNYLAASNLRIPIMSLGQKEIAELKSVDLIVDALFGIGLCRDLKGKFRDVVRAINVAGRKILSVDVPSGLDATTGKVWGVAVKADVTLALAYAKIGFHLGEGPKHTGRIKVVDIGIPYGHVIQ